MSDNIIVIGAGVSGTTTALTLQLLGYETEIYTDKAVTDTINKRANPEFASLFPSASVIPHSVYSSRLKELFLRSQSFFYELRKLTFPGVTIHKHYEIFESEPVQPDYCNWMLNLQTLDEIDDKQIPRRPGISKLYGWAFDCIFADWALYMPSLYECYEQAGGTITRQKLAPGDIPELAANTVINCSGTGSPVLFDDPSDQQLIQRGHLLHKTGTPLLTNADNEIISYNYTPSSSIYADSKGNPCDVYCYPRKDGWVLGGSRQTGELGTTSWSNDITKADTYKIDDISFPKQIIDLNREILVTTFGAELDKSDELAATVGYRYIRNRQDGLRLEAEVVADKKIIHNYGLGGAGVTLSWGCALDIASMISSDDSSNIESKVLTALEKNDNC